MVKFGKTTLTEDKHIEKIIERDEALRYKHGLPPRDRAELMMDLLAVHHHTPLDFERMAHGRASDLAHDLGGIARHIDRTTGLLQDCFLPRFAKQEEPA